MSFATFSLSELPADHDDDYQIEFCTGDTRLGIRMSEDEAGNVADALHRAVEEDDFESWDAKDIGEPVPEKE